MSNHIETITFLSNLREVLDLNVSSMEGISEDEKSSLGKFIMNEATDYEIVHFVTTGKFPQEKYNLEGENICMEAIKDALNSNYFELSEIMTEEGVDTLIESIEPLSAYGLSSNATVLEYLVDSGLMTSLLEGDFQGVDAKKMAKKRAEAKAGVMTNPSKIAGKGRVELNKDAAAVEDSDVSLGDQVGNAAYQAKANTKKYYKKGKTLVNNAIERGKDEIGRMKLGTKGNNSDMGNVGDQIVRDNTKGNISDMGGVGDEYVKIKNNEDSATTMGQKIMNLIRNNGKAIGGTVVAAGLLYGAYKTYKRFFSKAARACSGKSGAARDACVVNFKKNAIKAQISDLKKSAAACKTTKSPQKCQAAINAKIQKLQGKLA